MSNLSTPRLPRHTRLLSPLREVQLDHSRLHFSPFTDTLIPLSVGLRRKLMLQLGAREREAQLYGSTVHYYYAPGRGDVPVVLVHGIADNATTWSHVFAQLRSIGDVYVLDLPGFGYSSPPPGQDFVTIAGMREVLAGFLHDVVGQPVLMVGNSMGAWMGLQIGLQRPELLRGLVAINPGGAPLLGRESWQPFIDMASVPDLNAVRAIYRRMFARPPIRFPLYAGQRGFQRLFASPAVQRLLQHTTEEDFLIDEELCNLRVPLGIIWGIADQFLPAGSLEFFQHCLPGAHWILLPATGHLPQIERPGRVISFTRRFAAELRTPASPPHQAVSLLSLLMQHVLFRRSG